MYLQSVERRESDGKYIAQLLESDGREVITGMTLDELRTAVLLVTSDVERVERLFARMAEWESTHPYTGPR